MATHWIYNINIHAFLKEAEYIFEFEGKKFRLIRGTDIESDKLTTISDGSKESDFNCRKMAMRFIDYISWEMRVPIQYLGCSGHGVNLNRFNYDNAPVHSFHKRTLRGRVTRVKTIPKVVNETQRIALSLWHESDGTNSVFLSFINYWKILELPPHDTKRKGKPHYNAIDWINTVSSSRIAGLVDLRNNIPTNRKD